MDYPSSSSSIAASRLELGGADGTSQEEEERERDQRERNFNGELQVVEKEHMFDKVVTPSDVGKLNRLVIPKQHAEKYFPLDSSRDEKGLLLNFEDRTGKSWRFRYSYWNSSQSYVMTKGWSRFVKEKKLDAGDIVSFHRTVGGEKFFIDWRRRRLPDAPPLLQYISVRPPPPLSPFVLRSSSGITTATPYHLNFHQNQLHIHHLHHHHHPYDCDNPNPYPIWDHLNSNSSSSSGGTATTYTHLPPMNVVRSTVPSGAPHSHWIRNMVNFSASPTSNTQFSQVLLPSSGTPSPTDFRREDGGEEEHRGTERMVFDSVPVVQGKAAGKRLRLFGVNMDCANHNNDMSRDYNDEDAAAAAVSTSISDDRRLRVHHRRQAAEALGLASESSDHGKRLPLQLRLPVDKGKLSSSSSPSMSLDLDM